MIVIIIIIRIIIIIEINNTHVGKTNLPRDFCWSNLFRLLTNSIVLILKFYTSSFLTIAAADMKRILHGDEERPTRMIRPDQSFRSSGRNGRLLFVKNCNSLSASVTLSHYLLGRGARVSATKPVGAQFIVALFPVMCSRPSAIPLRLLVTA